MNLERPHRRLLVVDDEPLVRESLRMCLKDAYDVELVASGEEAIARAEQELFPVVILDLRMEGLSGIETLKRLKQIRAVQNIIILTAYESLDTAVAALNSGAFNYLRKPFDNETLYDVIERGFQDFDSRTLDHREVQQRLMGVHDSFFSMLCHEFNTPLNGILGFAEMLSLSTQDSEHAEWIRDIQSSGNRLHRVLMEMVDYIAASHLAMAGMRKPFVPATLLKGLDRWFSERKIQISIDPDEACYDQVVGFPEAVLMIARKMVSMASHHSEQIGIDARILRDSGSEPNGDALFLDVTAFGASKDSCVESGRPWYFDYDPGAEPRVVSDGLNPGLELATCRKIAEYVRGSVEFSLDSLGEITFSAIVPICK